MDLFCLWQISVWKKLRSKSRETSEWTTRPHLMDGNYFHAWCPSVSPAQKKQNMLQRYMEPGGSLWSFLTWFSLFFFLGENRSIFLKVQLHSLEQQQQQRKGGGRASWNLKNAWYWIFLPSTPSLLHFQHPTKFHSLNSPNKVLIHCLIQNLPITFLFSAIVSGSCLFFNAVGTTIFVVPLTWAICNKAEGLMLITEP